MPDAVERRPGGRGLGPRRLIAHFGALAPLVALVVALVLALAIALLVDWRERHRDD